MWKITKISTNEELYIQPEKERISIGKQGDFILQGDTSISRNHAILTQSEGRLFVADLSKYGTYLNDGISSKEKIPAKSQVQLKVGDTICFGICQNEWVVGKSTLKTVATSFTLKEKAELKAVLEKMHIEMQDKFESSTSHLTTDVMSVTVKVLHAVMENIPIVTTQFWIQFYENLKGCKVCPKAADFKPKNDNDFLKILDQEIDRTKIFAGKIFIFINKVQKENYAKLIELGGGKVKLLTKQMSKSVLIRDSVVCIQYSPNSQSQMCSQTTNDLFEFVLKNNRRLIPEHEIGLAIVTCSIEKYCNPKHKIISDIMPNTESEPNAGTELVEETPTVNVKSPDEKVKENTASIELFDSGDELMSSVQIPEVKKADAVAGFSLDEDDELLASVEMPASGKRKASPSPKAERKTRKIENDENVTQRTSRSTRSSTASSSKANATISKPSPQKRNPKSPAPIEKAGKAPPGKNIVPDTVPNTDNSKSSQVSIAKAKPIIETNLSNENVDEEPKIPITSTQTSEPQQFAIEESEIFNSEQQQKTEARKRRIVDDDDSDEDNFFTKPLRKNKKLMEQKEAEAKVVTQPSKPSQPPQSEEFISRGSKSSTVIEPVKVTEPTTKKSKSRGKLVLLENENDGDESFFNYGKKFKASSKEEDKGGEDDVFNFSNSRTQAKKRLTNRSAEIPTVSTSAIREVQKKEPKDVLEYKIEPLKLTLDGWLSSSVRTMKLEDDHECENPIKTDPAEQEWIESIKGCIKVETLDCSTFIRSRSFANVSNVTSNTSSINNLTNGGKNFKKFVKLNNYKPQTHVITTIPFHVDCSEKFF